MAAASSSDTPSSLPLSGPRAPDDLVAERTVEYAAFVGEAGCMGISEAWAQRFWAQKKGRIDDARKALGKFKALADDHGLWTLGLDEDTMVELESGKFWMHPATETHPAVLGIRSCFHDAGAQPASQTLRSMMVLQTLLLTDANASKNGIIMIMDAMDMGWSAFSMESEKTYMAAMQGLPVRYPAFVVLNPTTFMRTVINIMWPFTPNKMRDRLRIAFAADLEASIGAHAMPAYMGGPVPTDAATVISTLKKRFRAWITPDQQTSLVAEADAEALGSASM